MAANGKAKALAGFVVFAGALMMVVGLVNVFQGFVAIFADDRLVVTQDNFIVVDMTAWGWLLVGYGLVMMAVGAGLLSTQTWARITGIIVVSLHAVLQIAWIGAYPIWSLLMIGLDTVILYALTVRWSDVRDTLGTGDAPWDGAQAVPPASTQRTTPPLSR
jgi:hypothetical protein